MSETEPPQIDSLSQLTTRGKGEVKRWIETWLPMAQALSADAVAALGYIRFNSANDELAIRWLDIDANGTDPDGYSIQMTGDSNVKVGSTDSLLELVAASYIRARFAANASFDFQDSDENTVVSIFGPDLDGVLQMVAHGPITDAGFIALFGLSGAQEAARWVGATGSGAPVAGDFVTGDWVTTQDGHVFICTASGTPGTWVGVGIELTADELAAIQGANSPDAGNPFATIDDLGGGITEITSTDGTAVITDPTGPTVDLSVAGVFWEDV